MITVVGSINMDIVCQTDVFPQQGETVLGQRFETIPGGKVPIKQLLRHV